MGPIAGVAGGVSSDYRAKIVLIPELPEDVKIVIVWSATFVNQVLGKGLIVTLAEPKFNGESVG